MKGRCTSDVQAVAFVSGRACTVCVCVSESSLVLVEHGLDAA